jgi:hypothetical protein
VFLQLLTSLHATFPAAAGVSAVTDVPPLQLSLLRLVSLQLLTSLPANFPDAAGVPAVTDVPAAARVLLCSRPSFADVFAFAG